MPTYEFRCPNGHQFDEFHRISDAPSTVPCPECGAQAERAISGGAGLVFKGSGFYLTDYGKNAHRGSAPAAKGDSAKGDGGKGESSGGGEGGGKSDTAKTDGAVKPAAPTSAPSTPSSSTSSGGAGGKKAGE